LHETPHAELVHVAWPFAGAGQILQLEPQWSGSVAVAKHPLPQAPSVAGQPTVAVALAVAVAPVAESLTFTRIVGEPGVAYVCVALTVNGPAPSIVPADVVPSPQSTIADRAPAPSVASASVTVATAPPKAMPAVADTSSPEAASWLIHEPPAQILPPVHANPQLPQFELS
jgi:hypothetical protein